MNPKAPRLKQGRRGAALAIRVAPRSSRNEIAEILSDGTVKIRLTAPPLDGQANDLLIELLSGVLEVPKSKIEIVAGAGGREKLVTILDLDPDTVHQRILRKLA